MPRPLSALLALACSLAALCLLAPLAAGEISFAPCGESNDFACGHLTVPLDPSGATAGTLTLAIRRHRAAVGEARTAIVALAGGPGQPAIPFAEQFAELLGPIAATRDLIVFDQRGIGLSDPLSCHAFERLPAAVSAPGRTLSECAGQLGSARSDYTTADTVADIEAIRQAGGYEKLVLYGTSYGTKVAEEYAQAHPDRVEALVLDSVVPPNGPDTLARPTFAAIPRILRQICLRGGCAGVTRDPVADLARLLAKLRSGPLRGRALGPDGRPQTITITRQELLATLLAGDFSGGLRAALVSSTSSAARGDLAPLARLLATVMAGESEHEDFDVPLYYATTCEEQQFPWSRASSPAQRIEQALAAARALPSSDFAPFDAADAIGLSDIPACANWPFTSPLPPLADAPLPAVPTLILSGADDLRTPTANAVEVAHEIPGSHLLVVPFVGHSVLGSDQTPCASKALQALFASGHIEPCPPQQVPPALRPEPRPPLRLAALSPARGYPGQPGRTVRALEVTIEDLARQLSLTIETSFSAEELLSLPSLRIGGLRSGWVRLGSGGLEFHDYAFIPGVTLSGSLREETADLRVGGSSAARGTLRLGAGRILVGRLGGTPVRLPASPQSAMAIVGTDATASSEVVLGRHAGADRARLLTGELRRVLEP
ncbi:MAG: alpha/beta hydrolase [Solirubrobacteraceae bacterium]